jgi:hypothetical protein
MFNVHGSVHRNNILVCKSQQDAHMETFFSALCFQTPLIRIPSFGQLFSDILFATQNRRSLWPCQPNGTTTYAATQTYCVAIKRHLDKTEAKLPSVLQFYIFRNEVAFFN